MENGPNGETRLKLGDFGLEEVVKFKYLGVTISVDGGMMEELTHMLHEGKQICWRWEYCGRRMLYR